MTNAAQNRMAVRHVVWPVGLFVIAASIVMTGDNSFTTYGGLGSWWRWSETAAALALLASGTVVARSHPRSGLLTAALGLLWLAPEWTGWTAGPDWLRIVALSADAVVLAVATAVAASVVRITPRHRALVLRVGATGAALVAVARAALLDPFNDPRCWRTCRSNTLAIDGHATLGHTLERIGLAVVGLAALGIVVAVGRRAWRDRSVAALGAAVVVAGLALAAASRLFVMEDPRTGGYFTLFVAVTCGAVVLSAGLAVDRWREWRLGAALFEMVAELRAAPPGTIDGAIARAIGDPSVRVLYWSAARREYVDAEGRSAPLPASHSTTATMVVRRGQPVAVVTHDRAIDGSRIARAIGPAVRLSLENEQLRAAALAELAESKASRVRIVERADAERWRLERNLHDGAQQRIVGIGLLLRTIRTRLAGKRPAAPHDMLLVRAEQLVAAALEDLRRLAAGIHPAVLSDGGLRAAVPDLAEGSTDVAVRIDALPAGRQPAGVEATAYFVVAEAVADARHRVASIVSVSARDTDGRLVVDVVDDSPLGDDGHLASELDDRVGALDGRLTVAATEDGGTRVHLELPCAS